MVYRSPTLLAVTCALLVVGSTASAQPADGFSSDRPGYANTTSTAPSMRPIVEFGTGFTIDEDDPETIFAPAMLFRLGLGEHVELRLAAPNVVGIIAPGPNSVAYGDTVFGFKVGIKTNDMFSSSFVSSIGFDTDGGGGFTGRLEWNWALALGTIGLSGNLAGGTSGGSQVLGEGSIALSVTPDDTLSIYGQFFMLWPVSVDPLPYVGIGIAAQVAPRFQVDAYMDIGLTEATTRFTAGVGMTVLVGSGSASATAAAPAPAATAPTATTAQTSN